MTQTYYWTPIHFYSYLCNPIFVQSDPIRITAVWEIGIELEAQLWVSHVTSADRGLGQSAWPAGGGGEGGESQWGQE